jgi:hypothetical protein
MSDSPTPKLNMQDRRATGAEPIAPDEASAGLQAAIRQLDGHSWEKYGSGVKVNRDTGQTYFDADTLFRFEIHQGNPDAIAELIKEARRPTVRRPRRTASRKPGYGAKIFR